MNKLVSVIMPTYNSSQYIRDAINSVLTQSYSDFELIIVNDGSTDNTEDIVKAIKDNRIKYIRTKNQGNYFARNRALEESKGKYIAFLDADDIWLRNKLKAQMDILNEHKEVVFCCTDHYVFFDNNKEKVFIDMQNSLPEGFLPHSNFIEMMLLNNAISTSSVLVRKACFKNIGMFDTAYRQAMDYDMWLRIILDYKSRCIGIRYVLKRVHKANISRNKINSLKPLLYIFDKLDSNSECTKYFEKGHRQLIRMKIQKTKYDLGLEFLSMKDYANAVKYLRDSAHAEKNVFRNIAMFVAKFCIGALVPCIIFYRFQMRKRSIVPVWLEEEKREVSAYAGAQKVNVCLISPGLPIPPSKGGAIETGIYESVRFYKETETRVFSEQIQTMDTSQINHKHVQYIQLKTNHFILGLQELLNRIARKGPFLLYDFFFIRRVANSICDSPQAIHVRNNFYYIPYLKRRFPESRIVLQMHNDFLYEYPRLYRKYRKIVELVDCIIAVSSYIGDRIAKHDEKNKHKIDIIYNGVSLGRFKKLPSDDILLNKWRDKLDIKAHDNVFIFVGRICEIKGVEILVKAFKKLCTTHNNVKLLIVGSSWFAEGRITPYLKKLYNESQNVKNKIIFTGFVAHDELNRLYNLSDICLVPSLFNEPFALVNLEAMATGCAVIASQVGGIPEIIRNNETGLLVEPNNIDALCKQMEYLLENKAVRIQLAENAMKYVKKNHDWSKVAKEYEAVYKKVLNW